MQQCLTHEMPNKELCPFCQIHVLGIAYILSSTAHEATGQLRKYSGEPYFNHPKAIALMMLEDGHWDEVVAAALLHDVVEDTDITEAFLRKHFDALGYFEVVDIVMQVTKPSEDMTEPRAIRKHRDHLHYASGDWRGQTLKCYDLNHNGQTLLADDPKFASVWFREAKQLLGMLDKADPKIRGHVTAMVDAVLEQIEDGGN